MKKLLLAAAAVLTITGAAHGGDFKPYAKVDAWSIDSNGTLCLSGAHYPHNGTSLLFGIGANGAATININNQAWSIPEGRYEIRAAVDGLVPVNFRAYGNDTTITWHFALSETNINILSKGAILHVYIGNTEYQYGLGGSAAMLNALLKCASQVAQEANPFANKPQSAPASTTNPFKRT